jgi:hypothetical protein
MSQQCVIVNGVGQIVADMSGTCTYVLTSSGSSVFDLSAAEAQQIALAIIGLWAVGFTFRVLIRMLGSLSVDSTEKE